MLVLLPICDWRLRRGRLLESYFECLHPSSGDDDDSYLDFVIAMFVLVLKYGLYYFQETRSENLLRRFTGLSISYRLHLVFSSPFLSKCSFILSHCSFRYVKSTVDTAETVIRFDEDNRKVKGTQGKRKDRACLLDLRKAYLRKNHQVLWKILETYAFGTTSWQNWNTFMALQLKRNRWGMTGKRVQRGHPKETTETIPFIPILFNIFYQIVMRAAVKEGTGKRTTSYFSPETHARCSAETKPAKKQRFCKSKPCC